MKFRHLSGLFLALIASTAFAQTKISELPGGAAVDSGTILPAVQGGVTVQVSPNSAWLFDFPANSTNSTLTVGGQLPIFEMNKANATTNGKRWRWLVIEGALQMGLCADDGTTCSVWGQVNRSAGTLTSVTLQAPTLNLSGTVAATGGSGVTVGSPTGGAQGAGTVNATGLFVNGVAVGAGTPGGSNTQVQYNNSGAFGGDSGMTYNAATDSLALLGNINVSGTEILPNGSQGTPTTGGSVNMAANKRYHYMVPAGTIATYTVNLPPSPVDGQVVALFTTQTITALTIGGQGGNTVTTTVTSLPANTGVEFMFFSSVWRQITAGPSVPSIPSQTNSTAFTPGCTGYATCPITSNSAHYSKTGNITCLNIQNFGGTSNSTNFEITGIPAAAAPVNLGLQGPSGIVAATNNAVTVFAKWTLAGDGSGVITFRNGITGSGTTTWTNSGSKGLAEDFNVCYANQ
jgi:hypothetical protein